MGYKQLKETPLNSFNTAGPPPLASIMSTPPPLSITSIHVKSPQELFAETDRLENYVCQKKAKKQKTDE